MRKLAFLFLVLSVLASCKKKDGVVGKDGIDPNTLLNSVSVDTFSLITYTEIDDSVITKNPASAVLGFYNDPEFGTVDASFYCQFRISGINPNFGTLSDNLVMDSVILSLNYSGYYGDQSPLSLEVNRLSEGMDDDSTYYAFSTLSTETANLIPFGYETITPDPVSDVVIGEDTVEATLRIPLDTLLGKEFITEAMSGTAFSSSASFLEFFKGLRVRTTNGSMPSGKGGIFYFNLNDPLSKLTIYYKKNGVPKSYDLVINSNSIDFNHVEIDNSGKNVQNVIDNHALGQSEFYAQAFKNRAIIKIPGLNGLPKKALIHKAQLYLPIQHQTGTKYFPGDYASVASHPVDDPYTLATLGVYGVYDEVKKHYLVDLRAFVQGVSTGLTENTDVVISPRYFINTADRIIFNGPNTSNKNKPKLVVTYTEY